MGGRGGARDGLYLELLGAELSQLSQKRRSMSQKCTRRPLHSLYIRQRVGFSFDLAPVPFQSKEGVDMVMQNALRVLIVCLLIQVSARTLIAQNVDGIWEGTRTTTRAASCSVGGHQSVTDSVRLILHVDSTGNIEFQERDVLWTGSVDSSLEITLTKRQLDFACRRGRRTILTDYAGVIEQEDGTNTLELEATESWCPLQGCVFRVHYSLSKKSDAAIEAEALLREGVGLVRDGNIVDAIAAYAAAQARDSTLSVPAPVWNTLCYSGSLWGHAADVMTACEDAVALAPWNGNIRDSRGVARALTGDLAGAIEDLEAFAAWTLNDEDRSQRQEWIDALRAGENPLTPEVLETLRTQ